MINKIRHQLTLFFALSRTQHGILDVAMPACCALLWLGTFPALPTILLGLLTAFAGYTAIYALNDLVGFSSDKSKMKHTQNHQGYSVESSDLRHPVAQGLLSVKSAVLWAFFWFIIALLGSYILNPVIILILITGGLLEIIYCLLVKVTFLRTLFSGLVKSCGPVAAVFAVSASPSWSFLALLLCWVFLWEIGGQNIPADWTDIEEDRLAGGRTLPIQFGEKTASILIFTLLLTVVILSAVLLAHSHFDHVITYVILMTLCGMYCLLIPAIQLYQNKKPQQAAKLFDKASYYPLFCLCTTGLACLLS